MKPPTGVPRARDYLRYVANGLVVIVAATAASVALGWFNWWNADPIYQSTATLFIDTDGAATPLDAANGQLTASGLILTYSELAASTLVTSPTIEELKLGETDEALAGRIQVAPTKSVILKVSVVGADADLTRRTANTVAHNMIAVSQEWTGLQATKSHLVLVDDAGPSVRIGSMWREIATAAALGLAVSCVLVIARSLIVDRLAARGDADRASMPLRSPPVGTPVQAFVVRDYFRLLARYGWVIVALTAAGAAIGWATAALITREYQSVTTLFAASVQSESSVTGAYVDNTFAVNRVPSYLELATSEQVAARVVNKLGLSISPAELQAKTSATPLVTKCGGYGQGICVPVTVLFNVVVTDPNPARAQVMANAVADQVVELVRELETGRGADGTAAVGVMVVDGANYPDRPVGFTLPVRLGVGTASGLALGVLVFLLVGISDRRVRSWEQVEKLTGSPVVGVLPKVPDRVLDTTTGLDAYGLYAEQLRELRTNVRSLVADERYSAPTVIAVTSPSRDGRSTVAVDLAVALSETGKSVVLVEADLYKPSVADRLALSKPAVESAATRGVGTVLAGEHTAVEAVIRKVGVRGCSIAFLPAGPSTGTPAQQWATGRATALLAEVGEMFDYVVVDTPPLEQYSDGALIAALAGRALVVARIRKTTSSALRLSVRALHVANVHVIGVIVTGDTSRRRGRSRRSARLRLFLSREESMA